MKKNMNVGIVGLGLIGGSAAKAYTEAGYRVYGADVSADIEKFAKLDGNIACSLTKENLHECALVLLCICPKAAMAWLCEHGACLTQEQLVIDFCGVKREICSYGFSTACQYNFTFVGGHPMAGSHQSGYGASRAGLFAGASMVVVPPRFDDASLLQRVKDSLEPLGFTRFTFCTAEMHDSMIAYTSQLPHIISGAYASSPAALLHRGYSAGSYRDLTRVAFLDADMWTELFDANRKPLLRELDGLIDRLSLVREALIKEDNQRLHDILQERREKKISAEQPAKLSDQEKKEALSWIES